jgi:transposase-like protein
VAARAKSRQYPTAFKLKAIKRAEGGEGVVPVARKLGISRKLLHDWIKSWKAHGPEGLNRKRGPKPGPRKLKPLQAEENKRTSPRRARASSNSNGWWAASSWTSIFFEKPCAPWSGRQRKANPHPHRRSY